MKCTSSVQLNLLGMIRKPLSTRATSLMNFVSYWQLFEKGKKNSSKASPFLVRLTLCISEFVFLVVVVFLVWFPALSQIAPTAFPYISLSSLKSAFWNEKTTTRKQNKHKTHTRKPHTKQTQTFINMHQNRRMSLKMEAWEIYVQLNGKTQVQHSFLHLL